MDMFKSKIEKIDVHIVQIFHSYFKGIEVIMPSVGFDIQGLAQPLDL